MSWWQLHYLFLFLLGGVVATKYEQTYLLLQQNYRLLRGLLIASLLAMLAHYYGLLFWSNYALIQAVNTVHQLSPAGVLYSVTASLFLLVRFDRELPGRLRQLLAITGNYSYSIFWLHPFFLHYLHQWVVGLDWQITVPVAAGLYLATVLTSLAAAIGFARLRS